MHRRGQGAFEYILLLGGVLMIVAIAFIILRSTVLPSGKQNIEQNVKTIESLTCLPTYMSTRPAHWWKFDEGSGATAKDSAGGSDGTVTNPQWVGGISGQALQFQAGSYASIQGDDSTRFSRGSFTLEAWIARTDDSGNPAVIHSNGLYDLLLGFDGFPDDDILIGKIFMESGAPFQRNGNIAVKSPGWHHIAMTYDDATGELAGYLDGKQEFADIAPSPYGPDIIADVEIPAAGQPLNGIIDQVVFYGRALSPEEIRADYACVHNAG